MARKISSEWFAVYRQAEHELSQAVAEGRNRAEAASDILARLNRQRKKGLQAQSFARQLKAGRYLDAQRGNLEPSQVQCSYVQVELLERLSRLSPKLAQELLPAVLCNELSAEALNTHLAELKSQNPLANSLISRDNMRQVAAAHERQCAQGIQAAGSAFFGAPTGFIAKLDGAHELVAPAYVVVADGEAHASIFLRVGSKSQSPMTTATELYFLALAHRTASPHIWLLFPERSSITDRLAFLAWRLGGAPDKGDWLHIGIVDEGGITPYALRDYPGAELLYYNDYGNDEVFQLRLKRLDSGQPLTLNYLKPYCAK